MQLIVATIASAHGLKGEVKLQVRTDDPERRFAPGNVLEADPSDAGPLTVVRTRRAPQGFFVLFAEASDRNQAEALRGVDLVVEADEEDADPDGWYAHQLTGLRVVHVDGRELGEVTGIEVMPAHDLLVVREPDGTITRVPFVEAIVLDVDEDAGQVRVDPPGGLFASDAPVGAEDDATEGTEGAEGTEDAEEQDGGAR